MRNKYFYLRTGIPIVFLFWLFCCSSSRHAVPEEKQHEATSKALPPAPVPLAPGVARVLALPLSYDQEDPASVCTFKIERVVGYGMSTPVLAIGSEIRAVVDLSMEQQKKMLRSARDENRVVGMILHSVPAGFTENGSGRPAWKIVDIEIPSEIK
jgi:hypothetical protein